MGKKKNLNKIVYDGLIFVEDGTVYSQTSMREIAANPRSNGHRYVHLPTSGKNIKLEYLMVVLFLKNGEFPERLDLWDIKFKDNDTTNCNVSNLELVVRNRSKRGRHKGTSQTFCLIDLINYDWEELSVEEISQKIGINKSTVRKYGNAEEKTLIQKRYFIGDYYDVWDYM